MAKQPTRARGFFRMSDVAKAASQALRFAGTDGRLGTMLDVVDARLATTLGSNAWERYWTTNSWELRGRSKKGIELLAVHHGGGPLGMPEGMAETYARSTREDVGARIPQKMFLDFLDGKHGPVATVELQPYLRMKEMLGHYPFCGMILPFFEGLMFDPLCIARLGPRWDELLLQHLKLARAFCDERGYDRNQFLISLEAPSNCCYPYRALPEGWAFAHMLVIGQPMNTSHVVEKPDGQRKGLHSLIVEIGCHERGHAVRMFGVRGADALTDDIQPETKQSQKRQRRVPTPIITVIDPTHPVDYALLVTPPNYRCGTCGATRCKLWREYQTMLDSQTLLCATCAAENQKKDISDMDATGMYSLDLEGWGLGHRTDQIGWYVPAVPTEANDTYWGYTSVPEAGCTWWSNLPTSPVTSTAPSASASV